MLTIGLGVGNTVFGELPTIAIHKRWGGSIWMPSVLIVNTRQSPPLQWILIPGLALTSASDPFQQPSESQHVT